MVILPNFWPEVHVPIPPTRWQTDAVAVPAEFVQSALFEVAFAFFHVWFLLIHLMDDDVELSLHDVDLPLG